jgi:hypothetical protein
VRLKKNENDIVYWYSNQYSVFSMDSSSIAAKTLCETIGDYCKFGYTSNLFRNTRFQLYDPSAVTQACNFTGYKCDETTASLVKLRTALAEHPERQFYVRDGCNWVAIPVTDEFAKRGFGRRNSVVTGSRIRCCGGCQEER